MQAILTLFGPLLVQMGTWLWNRVISNYKSTALGVAIGGVVYEGLTTFGCDPELFSPAILAAIAAAPKVIGTDADKVAPTIWGAMKDAVEQKKKSAQVLAEAQAAQDQAAKDAGIKSILLLICAGLLAGCSTVYDMGGGRYIKEVVVSDQEFFGTNDKYSKLVMCDGEVKQEEGLQPLSPDIEYRNCQNLPKEEREAWTHSSSPGQGGYVVMGALQALGLGILGALTGGNDTTVSQSQSQVQSQAQQSKTFVPPGLHKH